MPPPPCGLPGLGAGRPSSHLLGVHERAAEALQAHGPHQLVGVVEAQAQEAVHGPPGHVLGELLAVEKLSGVGTVSCPGPTACSPREVVGLGLRKHFQAASGSDAESRS